MKTANLIGLALDWAVAKCEDDVPADAFAIYSTWQPHRYSTNWAQGGPIIECEGIPTRQLEGRYFPNWQAGTQRYFGPTLLIAAMRCYVASKLGDKVDVPKELL